MSCIYNLQKLHPDKKHLPVLRLYVHFIVYIRATSLENLFMPYVTNKGADQPAHSRSLISAFVVHCLDSIIPLVFISEISSLYLASVAEQTGLSLTWSQTAKTGFLVTWLILYQTTTVFKVTYGKAYPGLDEKHLCLL